MNSLYLSGRVLQMFDQVIHRDDVETVFREVQVLQESPVNAAIQFLFGRSRQGFADFDSLAVEPLGLRFRQQNANPASDVQEPEFVL